jgi:SAM-dependent methyltransferase
MLNEVPKHLKTHGVAGVLRLIWIYLMEPWAYALTCVSASLYWLASWLCSGITGRIECMLRSNYENLQDDANLVKLQDLGFEAADLPKIRAELSANPLVVIAEIDQDGFFLPRFGPLPGIPLVSQADFMPRRRFKLDLIAIRGETVGVRKDFRGRHGAFLREYKVLRALAGEGLRIPILLSADFKNCVLVLSYIRGSLLREEIAMRGAPIRDRDTRRVGDLLGHSRAERRLRRIELAKPLLAEVVDDGFLEQLFCFLMEAHARGIAIVDIKYGNVLIGTDGCPWWIDFDLSTRFRNTRSAVFRVLRDADREAFNLHFGTEKLTRRGIQARITALRKKGGVYSAAYIGDGLRLGNLWDSSAGLAKWHFILKRNLPPFQGKRILDLGANNAFVSLTMLRHGAAEVVAFESNPRFIEQGEFLREAFQWHDNRSYRLRYVQACMSSVMDMDLGRFDIVMALCSIYYLHADDMHRLISHLSGLTDTLVLQCNTERNIGRMCEETYTKATLEYNIDALKRNGFAHVRVIAPRGYSRPLVIGSSNTFSRDAG